MSLFRILVAILIPPLGVALKYGFTRNFWINLILTILGYIPGVIHALIVI